MSSLLSIFSDKSIPVAKSLTEVLNPHHLMQIARKTGLVQRLSIFNPVDYLLLAISVCMSSPKEREYRLARFAERYNQQYGLKLAHKNIYDQLCKDEALVFTTQVTKEVLAVVTQKIAPKFRQLLPRELSSILRQYAVKDIILIDGVEISVYPGCADNFDCHGKGRNKNDGQAAKPGLKLHVAFSLVSMSFAYVEVTGACGNEKSQVLPERFHNSLLIMDRGYVSDELEDNIIHTNGNSFIIKGKRNMAGRVVRAYRDDGKLRDKYHGKKVSELPKNVNLDLDVMLKHGQIIRVIQRTKTVSRDNDCPVTILRTSVPRAQACLEQIFETYRIRWQVELGAKSLKSGNALHSINSSKLNLILNFINITLLSSLCKLYYGLKTIITRKLSWISLLKLQCSGLIFSELFLRLISRTRNIRAHIFKELADFIEENCLRSPPSKRDSEQYKDLPTLLRHILSIHNVWAPKASLK